MEIFGLRSERADSGLEKVAVVKMPTTLQWYRILRHYYQFTVFEAVRGAFWLVR